MIADRGGQTAGVGLASTLAQSVVFHGANPFFDQNTCAFSSPHGIEPAAAGARPL